MQGLWDDLLRMFSRSPDASYLPQAQCAALIRRAPLVYILLLANTWGLAWEFYEVAPVSLTIYLPVLFSGVCISRILFWSRSVEPTLSVDDAVAIQKRSNIVAAVLSGAFAVWAFSLFPYGDSFRQGYIAFFLVLSMIGSALCLVPTPSAALIAFGISAATFLVIFGGSGTPTFMRMAANMVVASFVFPIVILLHSRGFIAILDAQVAALRREVERERQLRMIDLMPVAVMTVDPVSKTINYANETSKHLVETLSPLLDIKPEELMGGPVDTFHKCPELVSILSSSPSHLPRRTHVALGSEVLELHVSAIYENDGSYLGPMLTWSIVTEKVEAEARMRRLAHFDPLTDLPNRASFNDQLNSFFASTTVPSALMLLDLDGFKTINDTRGHRTGDEILREVARRLRLFCEQRGAIVGRLGGDEFAISARLAKHEEVSAFAGSLLKILSAPCQIEGQSSIRVGVSIGIALAPEHGTLTGQVLSRADMALYAAKAAGKCTFRLFSRHMEDRMQDRVRLDADLRVAMDADDELFVFYQPIVDVATRRVTAQEALLRWHHPQRGWISPEEFIPIAEQSNLILQLGEYVLKRACIDAASWDASVRVAVNVSAAQLGRGTIVQDVLSALAVSGLAPRRLVLEATETALMTDPMSVLSDLRRLRDLGVRVALDDFGTGYSSLAHLRMFVFDEIKIDRSFVVDSVDRPDCAVVIGAVSALSKRLGATVVAEGVETEAQFERIRAEGCEEAQGYLLGRPVPHERDAALVARFDRTDAVAVDRSVASWLRRQVAPPKSALFVGGTGTSLHTLEFGHCESVRWRFKRGRVRQRCGCPRVATYGTRSRR